jgi:hypothetical protein
MILNIEWLPKRNNCLTEDIVECRFENDKAIGLRGIMIDITKTKKQKKDLKNSFNLVTEQNKRLLNFSYIVA